MNDFVALMVKFDSVSSNFNSIGYFFFKNNNRLDFKFVSYSAQQEKKIGLSIEESFLDFKEKFKKLQSYIYSGESELKTQTEAFNRYINLQIKNYGGSSVFIKRILELQRNGEEGNIKGEISDFMGEWKSNFIIRTRLQILDFHEITVTMAGNISKNEFDDLFKTREDLLSIPDIYPAIDPLEGKEIHEFNIGDQFYCIIINAKKETLDEIKQFYPKYFEGDTNVLPLPCQLISKEFLTQDRDMLLIKILIDNIYPAKGFVSTFSKILFDPERYYKRFKRQLSENEIIDENFERLLNESHEKKSEKGSFSIVKEKTKDYIIFVLFSSLMIIIILLFLIYFIF